MASKEFKLPPISPLIGSSPEVYRKTLEGHVIEPQFKTKKRLTELIIRILSPFRWYENAVHLPKARKVEPGEMVFIVGHWRGGTTYLHNLMCRAEDASFVTTYQTVFPIFMGSKGLLKPFIRAVMPDKRPSDNVKLNVEFPQEEEFALSGADHHSYYRFMYFPKDYSLHYDQATAMTDMTDAEKDHFIRAYRDLIQRAYYNKPGDLMIIKNPINTGRMKLLHELYPHAKWIHIYRNPYTVFRSTVKFFTELLPTLWFETVSKEFIRDMVLDIYVRLYKDFDDAIASIPNLNMVELKFEDFEQDPIAHLERIYKDLDIKGFETSREKFEQYVSSQRRYKKNVYEFPREMVEMVDRHWGEFVVRWGYGVPG